MNRPGCEFCDGDGGEVIVRRESWRIIRVAGADGAAYPGFCRVIWNEHVKELTDRPSADRNAFMEAVFALEAALRQALQPEKMNVASLGNLTPHLHWHVIPRYRDDPTFPKPVWAISTPSPSSLGTLGDKQEIPRDLSGAQWVSAVSRAFAVL
jgi:diadenosine tetraphosphate (Ap4A) HIT family hydrolase